MHQIVSLAITIWNGNGRRYQHRKWGLCVMSQWQLVKRLLPIVALALLLTGCGVPELSALIPSGEVAEKQLSLIILSISIMVLVFVVVAIIFTYVVIRYRARPGDRKSVV